MVKKIGKNTPYKKWLVINSALGAIAGIALYWAGSQFGPHILDWMGEKDPDGFNILEWDFTPLGCVIVAALGAVIALIPTSRIEWQERKERKDADRGES